MSPSPVTGAQTSQLRTRFCWDLFSEAIGRHNLPMTRDGNLACDGRQLERADFSKRPDQVVLRLLVLRHPKLHCVAHSWYQIMRRYHIFAIIMERASTEQHAGGCAETPKTEGGADEEGLAMSPLPLPSQPRCRTSFSHRISTERVRRNAARATRCALALGGQVGGGFNPASRDALALLLAPPDPMGQGTRRAHIEDALVNPPADVARSPSNTWAQIAQPSTVELTGTERARIHSRLPRH